jgi:Ca2+-binding RTX toxin-like protein
MARIIGDSRNNRLNGTDGRDIIKGRGGHDRLKGKDGNDDLFGGGGRDKLYGGAGDDDLSGGGGKDKMYGGAGDDSINGGSGDDYIDGGLDDDELIASAGNDVFFFKEAFSGNPADYSGFDTVFNFERIAGAAGDQIQLQDAAFGSWTAAESMDNTVFTFTDISFGVMATVTVVAVTGMVMGDDWVIV